MVHGLEGLRSIHRRTGVTLYTYVCDWVTTQGNPCGEPSAALLTTPMKGYSGHACEAHLLPWVRWVQRAAAEGLTLTVEFHPRSIR